MEKPAAVIKAKNKFLSFLPKAAKAAAALRFEFDRHNPPYSPSGNNVVSSSKEKHTKNQNKSGNYYNSGPITSSILQEARSKSKNSRFETKEPTSPKISCMGQIKISKSKSKNTNTNTNTNKKKKKKKMVTEQKKSTAVVTKSFPLPRSRETRKKSSSAMLILSSRKSDASSTVLDLPDRAPSLSQMKRFASSRETLSKFDWRNPTTTTSSAHQVSPAEEKDHHRRRFYNYYSDDDIGNMNYSTDEDEDEQEEEYEEEEIRIPFSAPLTVGGAAGPRVALEPRKEINLWKRRTMAQPKPLQLNK